MSNVLIKQHQLHKQAESVLKNLQLLSFLSTYGEVHTVGSFVTGLMTWPDIDIEVTHATLTLDNQLALAKFLLEKEQVKQVCLQDYRVNNNPPSRPKGLYLGVKYLDNHDVTWKIDIWLKEEKTAQTYLQSVSLIDTLTDEKKEIILAIKERIFDNPQYRKSIFSTDIYDAVLENNVTNVEEFKEYLHKHNKHL